MATSNRVAKPLHEVIDGLLKKSEGGPVELEGVEIQQRGNTIVVRATDRKPVRPREEQSNGGTTPS